MYYRRVNKNVGKNPVARAVARQQLNSVITTKKIQLYLLTDGAPCDEICNAIGFTLSVLVYAAELDKKVGLSVPEVRKMRGGISACVQMMDSNSYRTINTPSLDVALDAASEMVKRINADAINQAFNTLVLGGIKKAPEGESGAL